MNKRKISLGTAIMLMLLVAVSSVIITTMASAERYNRQLGDLSALESRYARFKEVTDIVDKYFVGEYDEEAAMDAALAGYVDGLGDKWSGYYTAEQTQRINEYNENTYVGVGITVMKREDGAFEITSVNKDGSAYTEGIVVTDVIYKVDGVLASEYETLDDLVAAVSGDEGTSVLLTILRDGEEIDKSVVRARIFNESVEARVIGNNIGYVYISGFENNVDKEFNDKVKELADQGVKGLIFDVRFNGGGYVEVMKNMLDTFLPEGMIISMVYKNGRTVEYKSDADCIKLPIVVITNEYSISAAEFFAAALQEYGVAKVVGDKTGGKGYAQSMFGLSGGGSVNISVSRYYTPKGASLVGTGITPDVEVSLSPEDFVNFYSLTDEQDTQLQAALSEVDKMAK